MPSPNQDHVPSGVFYILLGILLLSAMDAAAKWMVVRGISPIQILALRSIAIVPAMVLLYALRGQIDQLRPTRRLWHFARGTVGFLAPVCFFLALRYLPLSDAVVVFFSSTFVTTMLSVLVLKERVGWHRWAAVAMGYVGVLIAMAPKGEGEILGYLLVLVASLTYAFLFVSGRYLSATESVASLVFSFNASVGLYALVLLPFFWSGMSVAELTMLMVLAVLAFSGHLCVTTAFARAPASVVVPFEYSALLWAVCFDYLFWQQVPANTTWAGAALIVGSGLYVWHRERLHAGKALTAAP